jgi:ArsR family transcriptional regulator
MTVMATLPSVCCAPGADPLPAVDRERIAARFKALADPARVGIVNLLSSAEEVCVCELVEPLGIAQPTVSHHLRVLREAGLVNVSKRGTWSYYRLEPEALSEVAAALGAQVGARLAV